MSSILLFLLTLGYWDKSCLIKLSGETSEDFRVNKSKTTKMADDIIVFHKEDLPKTAFPVFEDIRRQGKLCDVTLKVNILMSFTNLQR